MPNGFYGSKEEWERMVAPLRELDAGIDAFAAPRGLEVVQNYHGMPNRMIAWTEAGIRRVIQISLYGENQLLLLAQSAYKDEGGRRRGKRWPVKQDIPLPQFKADLERLLAEAYLTLEAVSDADLEH
jgi:hypothetical protein